MVINYKKAIRSWVTIVSVRWLTIFHHLGRSEVAHFEQAAFWFDQAVVRFEVAVDHLQCAQISHAAQQLIAIQLKINLKSL